MDLLVCFESFIKRFEECQQVGWPRRDGDVP